MTIETKEQSKQLTEMQINKITMMVIKASEKLKTNAQIITLAHNLKRCMDIEEKRKWIVIFFSQCFQLLQFMSMARDDTRSMEEFEVEVKKLFKEIKE